MILEKDFEDFIKLLNKYKVAYMIVGGYALALHGRPRHILNSIDGISFNDASIGMQKIHLEVDIVMNYIGLDDFLVNKQASGRKQDLADVREIKKLQAVNRRRKG